MDAFILPAPSQIATALWDDRSLLWSNLLVTAQEVGLGILLALVLVYVGAVMVLFLFVVMMLDVNFDTLRQHFRSYLPIGAAVGVGPDALEVAEEVAAVAVLGR